MLNTEINDYYRSHFGASVGLYFAEYLADKKKQDRRLNVIMLIFIISVVLAVLGISKPIFAKTDTGQIKVAGSTNYVYLQKNFEENIKNKYAGSYVTFPHKGIAHIKKVKYINSKPIKINIVELNTNVNPYLKIKPSLASNKLNSKTTVRKIAQKDGALVAINGGFFKPQTGVPLGALMIDEEIITGPIYNRVGIAIFEENNKTTFKMANIDFDIHAVTAAYNLKIDNINQPRMLSTHVILYNSLWGNMSPTPPKNGYNLLVQNNKITKVSANPIQIFNNDIVIQGPKEEILKLLKDKNIKIKVSLQDGLEGAKHIIGAGPYLVKNSQIYVDVKTQKLEAISGKNPRSAIGYKDDGSLIIVTVDGREQASVGMTLFELAKFMKSLGCEFAMNFDGGSSSAMYVKGRIVNSAVNKEGIAVSNALIVSELNPETMQISSL